jgi:RNA polymerase sigma-70 factor, ECF subfamily
MASSKMSSPERLLPLSLVWEQKQECSPHLAPDALPTSDEELMLRLRAQDCSALELLFNRHSRLVFGITLRILRNHSECEDVVQDVFFYVYQKSFLFDPAKGSAKGWIVQVAFSRALDRRASLARRAYYSGTNLDLLGDTLLGAADVEREVEARLNRTYLERAFEDLPIAQRRTIELFYFEGLDLREISERLKQSLGNVRHHFYRGLERLRRNSFVQSLRAAQRR